MEVSTSFSPLFFNRRNVGKTNSCVFLTWKPRYSASPRTRFSHTHTNIQFFFSLLNKPMALLLTPRKRVCAVCEKCEREKSEKKVCIHRRRKTVQSFFSFPSHMPYSFLSVTFLLHFSLFFFSMWLCHRCVALHRAPLSSTNTKKERGEGKKERKNNTQACLAISSAVLDHFDLCSAVLSFSHFFFCLLGAAHR